MLLAKLFAYLVFFLAVKMFICRAVINCCVEVNLQLMP